MYVWSWFSFQFRSLLPSKRLSHGDFPGGPVAKSLYFHCRGTGSIPGQRLRSHLPCSAARKKKTNPQTQQNKKPHQRTKNKDRLVVCSASMTLSFVQQIHTDYLTHSPDSGLGTKRRGRKSGDSPHSRSHGDDGTSNWQQKFEEVKSHDPRNPAHPLYPSLGLDLSAVRPLCPAQCQAADTLIPHLGKLSRLPNPPRLLHYSPPTPASILGQEHQLTRADIPLRPDSLSPGHKPLHYLPPLEPGSWVCPPLLPTILNRTLLWLLESTNYFTWRGESSICHPQMHLLGRRISLSWLNSRHQRSSGQPTDGSLFWKHFPSKGNLHVSGQGWGLPVLPGRRVWVWLQKLLSTEKVPL